VYNKYPQGSKNELCSEVIAIPQKIVFILFGWNTSQLLLTGGGCLEVVIKIFLT